MRLDAIFNQYFLFVYVIGFITHCFGEEHPHDHSINSIESNKIIEDDLSYLSLPLSVSHEDEQRPATDQIEIKIPQTYWPLPKQTEPNLGLTENSILRFTNLFSEVLRTTLFGYINNRESLMNTVWIGSMCFLFGWIFLSMGTKRVRRSRCEQQIRAQCQQLQQHNDQMEFEYATFKRKHQKLVDQMDEMKNVSVRHEDEIFYLRKKYAQLQEDLNSKHAECMDLQKTIDCQQDLVDKHESDMQKQLNIVTCLNNEILVYQQELEKERRRIHQLQPNDLSLERFENFQEMIEQLKQEKSVQADQLQQTQDQANQLDLHNHELMIKMKHFKDLLEQREKIIARIPKEILNDILPTIGKDNSDNNEQILLTIDKDMEKANQRMRHLHNEIEDKTRRVKELDTLLNQEKDRCRELETKLKVVLELRERDAHLHIRQLGHTDAELRKARTDTERVRILQQQLEFKQKELDDVQKVLGSEQTKFSEDCSKLQHEIHEKWMEVKRLTRELDGARKECEGLRRQITKYANNDRSSQEKTMDKPVVYHSNNSDHAKK